MASEVESKHTQEDGYEVTRNSKSGKFVWNCRTKAEAEHAIEVFHKGAYDAFAKRHGLLNRIMGVAITLTEKALDFADAHPEAKILMKAGTGKSLTDAFVRYTREKGELVLKQGYRSDFYAELVLPPALFLECDIASEQSTVYEMQGVRLIQFELPTSVVRQTLRHLNEVGRKIPPRCDWITQWILVHVGMTVTYRPLPWTKPADTVLEYEKQVCPHVEYEEELDLSEMVDETDDEADNAWISGLESRKKRKKPVLRR